MRVGERHSRDRPWRPRVLKQPALSSYQAKTGKFKVAPNTSTLFSVDGNRIPTVWSLFLPPVTVRASIASIQQAFPKLLLLPGTVLRWMQAVPTVTVKR